MTKWDISYLVVELNINRRALHFILAIVLMVYAVRVRFHQFPIERMGFGDFCGYDDMVNHVCV